MLDSYTALLSSSSALLISKSQDFKAETVLSCLDALEEPYELEASLRRSAEGTALDLLPLSNKLSRL